MTHQPTTLAAAPPCDSPERIARIHASLLALAAHAAEMAQRLDAEHRIAAVWSFLPLLWLLGRRPVRQSGRARACARMLSALAAMFAMALPPSAAEAEGPTTEEDPWAALAGQPRLADLLVECPHPVASRANSATIAPRPLTRRRRPPQPRLLPPSQAAPSRPPTVSAA